MSDVGDLAVASGTMVDATDKLSRIFGFTRGEACRGGVGCLSSASISRTSTCGSSIFDCRASSWAMTAAYSLSRSAALLSRSSRRTRASKELIDSAIGLRANALALLCLALSPPMLFRLVTLFLNQLWDVGLIGSKPFLYGASIISIEGGAMYPCAILLALLPIVRSSDPRPKSRNKYAPTTAQISIGSLDLSVVALYERGGPQIFGSSSQFNISMSQKPV